MEEIRFQVPEGYELDKENSSLLCIKLKKIEKKLPMAWEELKIIHGYYVDIDSTVSNKRTWETFHNSKNLFPSKEEAEAMLAMSQLCQLRDVWNEGWKPNWCDDSYKYCFDVMKNEINICEYNHVSTPIYFKTKELAQNFLIMFKDLLETSKPFL